MTHYGIAAAPGVVDAIAEAMRKDGVVNLSVTAILLREREVLVGGSPVAEFGGDRLEVALASKLHGAEALGQLASNLRDVAALGSLDEDSLHAKRLQLGRGGSAAFRIPLNPRHLPTLQCYQTTQRSESSDMAAARTSVLKVRPTKVQTTAASCSVAAAQSESSRTRR